MSTSCMQAIKQQLEAMPLEEFEDLLKGVSEPQGHEGRPQHGELISQLKHHVKVQPDEPIQTKPTEKECKTIWDSFANKDNNSHNTSINNSRSNSGEERSIDLNTNDNATVNGNILHHTGSYLPHYSRQSTSLSGSGNFSSRSVSASGDQNANPIASSSSTCSNTADNTSIYPHSTGHLRDSVLGKYPNINNHHHQKQQSTLTYSNSLDGDPGGYNNGRRSHERERDPNSNKTGENTAISGPSASSNKHSLNENVKSKDEDDDDTQETYLDPEEFTGSLPPQYVLPGVTKFNATSKDLPLQLYPKPVTSCPLSIGPPDSGSIQQASTSASSQIGNSITSGSVVSDDSGEQPGTSKPWDLRKRGVDQQLQLKDDYKSLTSVTSGSSMAPTYMGKATSSVSDETYGTIRAVSPTLSNAVISKSPTIDGSQSDKPSLRRGAERKKKSSRNVLRETVVNPQEMPGYIGNENNIDKLLEFVEGNQTKAKKTQKDKKQRESKPSKGNEKQVLSKAASLDENSLGYGSKKSEETAASNGSRNRNSKDVEKKNSANITKSASSICGDDTSILRTTDMEVVTKSPTPPRQQESKSLSSSSTASSVSSNSSSAVKNSQSQPLVNGGIPPSGPKVTGAKTVVASNSAGGGGNKTAITNAPKTQTGALVAESKSGQTASSEVATVIKSEPSPVATLTKQTVVPVPESKQGGSKNTEKNKSEDERFVKPDESDVPYVLVQSKKKREKKKQQRESENFARSHPEQNRREGVRPRRGNTERRKSVGSVPGSENSECSDDDSVRSLPAGECTPRERIPKPCSSSGGTPQTSYADIARMSKDENGKPMAAPTSTASPPSTTAPAPTAVAAATPPVAVVPPGPKTPTPVVKPSPPPPTVVAVASPEDMNFPALSPSSSSEKTATATSVNTAVWPCRPRIAEIETSANKEKQGQGHTQNNSMKSEDVSSNAAATHSANIVKDNAFPPVAAVSSSVPLSPSPAEPQKCSTNMDSSNSNVNRSLPSESVVQINNNINNNNKEVMVAGKSIMDNSSAPKADAVVQNGVLPRSNVIVDMTAKGTAPNKTRPEDKKAKDKSVKPILDEMPIKQQVSSKPASENGDFYSAEPVVFCGGKFDSSQLPVGQKIGFEFGFGVIEALNDNNGVTESTMNGPKPVEFSPVVTKAVDADSSPAVMVTSNVTIRSQGRNKVLNHVDSGCTEKLVSLKDELPPVKPTEKPAPNNTNSHKNAGKSHGHTTSLTNSTTTGESGYVSVVKLAASVPTNQTQTPKSHPQKLSQPATTTTPTVVSEPIPPQAASLPQGHGSSKPTAVASNTLATPNLPVTTVAPSNCIADKALKETNTPKIDFAQIFSHPKKVTVPETLYQAHVFMETYVSRLTNLSKEGKITFHRLA